MAKTRYLVLAVLLFLSTGCGAVILAGAGAAAGVAGYKYYDGALIIVYEAPFKKTWDASRQALKEMDCTIGRSEHDITSGSLWGEFGDGKQVNIKLNYESADKTRVSIRVGVFGEKEASNLIKEKIRKILFKDA
ncbi:MAG: DUF3568 family protein [Deltaproteobacteria bacterium]|nr:DUF3568 family protein [Deltaproteobacteria bacterium]